MAQAHPALPLPAERRDTPWWIVGAPQDVALVIATPLLIVPPLLFLSQSSGAQLLLLALALGHHLPGLMRAYGDRDLFGRFRLRFVVGPLLLIPICVGLSLADLAILPLVVVVWGTWHGLAQTYGFARIYDAKQGDTSARTRGLDLALCIAWFGAGILFSPERMGGLLEQFYTSRGPLLPVAAVQSFQQLWLLGTALVSGAYLLNLCVAGWHGRPPNLPKLALLASACGFWWFAMVGIENAILGIAWFELFHDVQYLAIVWAFNRRVVSQQAPVGRFTRWLFRPSAGRVAIYVGAVLLYGLANPFDLHFTSGSFHAALAGVIASSSLLHFYYDGFIWKLRDGSLQAGLELDPERRGPRAPTPAGLRHALLWSALALLTLALGASQWLRPPTPELERYANLAAIVPDNPYHRLPLGDELAGRGRLREARIHYADTAELRPGSALAYAAQGRLLAIDRNFQAAAGAYRQALELDPSDLSTHIHLGIALFQLGELAQARGAFERALELDPRSYAAETNLGAICERQRDRACARRHYESALRIDPAGQVAREALRRVGL